MRYVEIDGLRLSVIGLGTWQFGSAEWAYGSEYAGRVAPALVGRALDLGINVIDTAEIYGFGASERIVGEALAPRRDEAFLATKLLPITPVPAYTRWRARASARRLRTDRLDLYQLHWPNPTVPLGVQMAGLRGLQDEGLVLHAGVSNYSLGRWQAAERSMGRPVLSNQVRFSLLNRRPLARMVPWAQGRGRVVIAYSPLAQGVLTGRYGPARRPRGMRARSRAFSPGNLPRVERLGEELREVGRRHGATASQVALAWLVRHPNVVAIPGASSERQVEENAAAAGVELSPADVEQIEAAVALYRAG